MNLPDMTNYNYDTISFFWGLSSGLVFSLLIRSVVQVIRLIINFIKWVINRYDG